MRKLRHISPTGLHLWESDREQFYLQRLCDNRMTREFSGPAASVGSSFDAYVKCALHFDVYGHDGDGVYNLSDLFNKQVENEEDRTFAWRAGSHCLNRYKSCGAYTELLQELMGKEPKFEFQLSKTVGGVPLLGKPDIYFYDKVHVLYDWKVMGYCSKYAQAPKKLYKTCRDTWKPSGSIKATRGGGDKKPHKGYQEVDWHGHKIGSHWMEDVDSKWADQLVIYGWMAGVPVGDDNFICGIDQLCCRPNPEGDPLIRVAQHRCRVSEVYQLNLLKRLQNMWEAVENNHIFDNMTQQESKDRCDLLDSMQNADNCGLGKDFWSLCNERQYKG